MCPRPPSIDFVDFVCSLDGSPGSPAPTRPRRDCGRRSRAAATRPAPSAYRIRASRVPGPWSVVRLDSLLPQSPPKYGGRDLPTLVGVAPQHRLVIRWSLARLASNSIMAGMGRQVHGILFNRRLGIDERPDHGA